MTSPGDLPEAAVTIRHARGEYPVYVGRHLLGSLPALLRRFAADRRVAVVSDDRVAAAVPPPLDAPVLTFPPGEASKTREWWARLTDRLLDLGFGRDTVLVALGGGVTGDLAGFVAATYLRGVPVIQVPTSLLAMLDASVGGKTGVDVPAGKNLVGAFHPPVAVLADVATLPTLPDVELRAGLAEAVKHAVIADRDHFEWLERHASSLLARDADTVETLLRTSIRIKAEVVAGDEFETGRRAVLNAGHTVAHAVEAAAGFSLRHGEAVAIGLVVEATLAERLGCAERGLAQTIATLLARFRLPTALPAMLSLDALLGHIVIDKKVRGGVVHCALPAELGRMHSAEGKWTTAVEIELLREVLQHCH